MAEKPKQFPYLTDYIFYGCLSAFGLACALGATFTPGNPPWGIVLVWVCALGLIIFPLIYAWQKIRARR